jgi:hypothetical protein
MRQIALAQFSERIFLVLFLSSRVTLYLMDSPNWRTYFSGFGKDKEKEKEKEEVDTTVQESDSLLKTGEAAALEFLSSINFGSDSEEELEDIPESERYEGDLDEAGKVVVRGMSTDKSEVRFREL